MPNIHARRVGRAIVAGLLGLSAAAAMASGEPSSGSEVVVSKASDESRSVRVYLSDLDFATRSDRDLLALRVNRAAERVCDVLGGGSAMDKLPGARACVEEARDNALAQLEARGLTVPTSRAAGGMR